VTSEETEVEETEVEETEVRRGRGRSHGVLHTESS